MAWRHYRLKLRLLSPLHIGYRKTGNLMETRRYVPGKNLWAALTARLTRDFHDGSQGREYRRIGELVREHFRFGYLWPSLDGESPCFPWDHADFDYLLLDSHATTALTPDQRAAHEGTLHDVEFIAPHTRTGEPVHLVGDLWVKESLPPDVEKWREALQRFALGGEQGYGWGRVELQAERPDPHTIGGFHWEESASQITVTVHRGMHLAAHAVAAGDNAVAGIVGTVEPLVGWERQQDGGYGLTSSVTVAYVPGSVVRDEVTVQVSDFGLWAATPPA